MSMDLTIYVGPYMTVDRGFDWMKWDHLICDGRMEAKEEGEPLILIPNQKINTIKHEMSFDRHSRNPMTELGGDDIEHEKGAFMSLAADAIDAAERQGYSTTVKWGVVPCWS